MIKKMTSGRGNNTDVSKSAIYGNLLSVSVAFCFIYSSYLALESLQSSLNNDGSLGVIAVSLLYACYFISVLYSPFVVDFLGTKFTLIGAFLAHTVYVISNFFPSWYSLLPASSLLGLLTAPQWTAQGVIVSKLAFQYASLVKVDPETNLTTFTGIFGFFMALSGLPGSLVSSLLLSSSDFNSSTSENVTDNPSQCGSFYCPSLSSNTDSTVTSGGSSKVTKSSLYLVVGVYLFINLCGLLTTVLFVKNVKSGDNKGNKTGLFKDLVKLCKDVKLLGTIVIVIYHSFSNSIYIAIFTNAYISCTLGVGMVGYGYCCFTIGRGLGCIGSGLGQRCVPRVVHFSAVYSLYGAFLTACLHWTPEALTRDVIIMYAMSFAIGLCNGVIDTQTRSLIGMFFPHKLLAAYSLRCVGEGLGYAVALAYMSFLCTRVVLYIHLGALVCSIVAYVIIEVRKKRGESPTYTNSNDAKEEDEKYNLREL